MQKLYRGKNVVEYYNTIHNKVRVQGERKHPPTPHQLRQHRRPRLRPHALRPVRQVPLRRKQDLPARIFGSTPIAEIGDRIKGNWDRWARECVGEEKPVAAVGDA
ncbi:hypothetical protein MRX96_006117 [Rhipicephalus microplus]